MFNIFKKSENHGRNFRIGIYLIIGVIAGGIIFFTGDYVAGTVLKIGNQASQATGYKLKLNNPASQTTVVPDGLIRYYKMDINPTTGVVTDYSTLASDGTLMGTPKPTAVPGKIGSALSFGSANNYVKNTYALNTSGNTVSFWFKPLSLTDRGIFETTSGGVNSANPYLYVRTGAGILYTYYNGYSVVDGYSVGTWYHLVIIRTATTENVYLNGVLKILNRAIGTDGENSQINIGVGYLGTSNSIVDEVRIYNRALTPAEVTALYTDKPLGASVGNHDTQAALPQFICGFSHVTGHYHDSPNTEDIIYGTVKDVNGRCWLDRNLGAPAVATSVNDSANYGWYYQWGRPTDGHQKISSVVTPNLSNSDTPGHDNFIYGAEVSPMDWRSPQSPNEAILWAGADGGSNNPCPVGWHVPTHLEWGAFYDPPGTANDIYNINTAFSSALKLPAPGYRTSGGFNLRGQWGLYWAGDPNSIKGYCVYSDSNSYLPNYGFWRDFGQSVRCIKDL